MKIPNFFQVGYLFLVADQQIHPENSKVGASGAELRRRSPQRRSDAATLGGGPSHPGAARAGEGATRPVGKENQDGGFHEDTLWFLSWNILEMDDN